MLTKGQFEALYQKSISDIKKLKTKNDELSKGIGIENEIHLYLQTEREKIKIESVIANVAEALQKLEKNYLEPDTARKIGNIRHQFRIQQDKRKELLTCLSRVKSTPEFQRYIKNGQKSEEQTEITLKKTKNRKQMEREENYYRKTAPALTPENREQQITMEGEGDYQMQRKLLRERGQCIKAAHAKISLIHEVVGEAQKMTERQGQKIDIISDDLFITHKNADLANSQLMQANGKQKSSKKKIISLVAAILIAVVSAIIILSM